MMNNNSQQVILKNGAQYIKNLHFETPLNKYELSQIGSARQDIEFKIGINPSHIVDGTHELILDVEIIYAVQKVDERKEEVEQVEKAEQADLQETEVQTGAQKITVFKLNLGYAGMFTIEGSVSEEPKDEILLVHCTTLLFPFMRREVSEIIVGAGFQPMMLDPIDFRKVYMERRAKSTEFVN